ncbi:palmitoyl-monogalactosyldiacylglycerol delta-7 desaturase, chloroplastic-like isoform X2 [Rosa rugosa]|uniref:palmitoyl-monogalactosyldiacylglycerol delta-7 desaturase, chloroplastic-like isoform X2 n=1 Tax=Rosa rugosa TaxID=74645 RepID=UPI002B413F33|nr:palmitoyl-monogalactosyldiacylglycerol delta-7 desaturase, chloroplastic-like isoform X2 [Rosa rugosa]
MAWLPLMVQKPVYFLGRQWNGVDIVNVFTLVAIHLLALLAPFHFTWSAFWLGVALYYVTGVGVTISFHRNLAHRSFKLPKWLEYFFAYCAVHSLQYDGKLYNVGDLKKQTYYKFLHYTYPYHCIACGVVLYRIGGMPYLVWALAVRMIFFLHVTFSLNSVCHIWGNQVWDTGDLSKNNWLCGLLAHGEGWHNNHHAFDYSARHGFEWWQIDITWYLIRFLEIVGLATDVKLPTELQKNRKALSNKISSMEEEGRFETKVK